MKRAAQILGMLALAGTLAAPAAFFSDKLSLASAQVWMLAAAGVWFATAPFWMKHGTRD